MVFDLTSWRDRFEQARSEKNPNLVRELLDELATEYHKMCYEGASSVASARFAMD
jgi:hypothetical protein